MHLAVISEGAVIQQRTIDGDEDWALQGAKHFLPNGLKWIDHRFGEVPRQFRLEVASLSTRGAVSLDRLTRKTQTTVEGRLFRALVEASWTDHRGQEFQFSAAEPGTDVLQAVLPDGKFTDYLFNKNHDKGGAKAAFILDELGFKAEDWRYLAAQFYDGLLLSEPRGLVIHHWEGGYGARFNVLVEVSSRGGKRGIMRTGWILEPSKLPRLVTAVPDKDNSNVARPSPPPVVAPGLEIEKFWTELLVVAREQGILAHKATVPTPALYEGVGIIEEGDYGLVAISITNDQKGFAQWIIEEGHGAESYDGSAIIPCNYWSPSFERAEAFAIAFARVLTLNGVPSQIVTADA